MKISDTNFEYPFIIKPLSKGDGGGYLIEFPDLPGCISDGDTIKATLEEGRDAVKAWIETAKNLKRQIPKPGSTLPGDDFSGKFVQRLPKTIHKELSVRAKFEGVSINTLALTYIAKGLGMENNSKNK